MHITHRLHVTNLPESPEVTNDSLKEFLNTYIHIYIYIYIYYAQTARDEFTGVARCDERQP
jgi:hypothetical protein